MKRQLFNVTGMSCAACTARVEKVISTLPGIQQVQVNLLTRSMRVSFDENKLTEADIITAVEHAGYGASTATSSMAAPAADSATPKRLVLSFILLLFTMSLHHFWHHTYSIVVQLILFIPIAWLNRKFYISGASAAWHKAPNMDTLIALGAAAGVLYSIVDLLFLHNGSSYVESAGMILTLITLGKWMESRATGHTGDALAKLKAHLPQTAIVLRGDLQKSIQANEVKAGETLIIPAGARVPVDARVCEGTSAIDESALTGESMPVHKHAGSTIYAGTINGNGLLRAVALNTRNESSLSHIIRLVGEAASAKAPIARLADRFAGIFVPVVVVLAIITALLWIVCGATLPFAIGCAVAVLVISCPCALGLATPVAIMTGAGKGAENGILFRDGATMENARKADVVVLDKTGTLTADQPIVTDITPAPGVSKSNFLQLVATLEQNSTHPLGQALQKACSAFSPQPVSEVQYLASLGIKAFINNRPCLAGNARLLRENGVEIHEQDSGVLTPIYFSEAGRYMGKIVLADPLKADTAAAIAQMKEMGLRVIIMSGDREESVKHIADLVGVSEYRAGVLPQDKEACVRQLQAAGHSVAMVGDGINDAPALMRADVGIAIGAGTDVAIDSAGIILVRSELSEAVAALRLSKAVIRTIRQNLFWAFFYNALAIPLAAGLYYPLLGWQLSPGIAAAAMSLSSLFVVCNALRLRSLTLHQTKQNTMNTTTISITGMMCPHCERHVAQALSALPGITEVKADHKSATVTIVSEGPVDAALLEATVNKEGYEFKGIC